MSESGRCQRRGGFGILLAGTSTSTEAHARQVGLLYSHVQGKLKLQEPPYKPPVQALQIVWKLVQRSAFRRREARRTVVILGDTGGGHDGRPSRRRVRLIRQSANVTRIVAVGPTYSRALSCETLAG